MFSYSFLGINSVPPSSINCTMVVQYGEICIVQKKAYKWEEKVEKWLKKFKNVRTRYV